MCDWMCARSSSKLVRSNSAREHTPPLREGRDLHVSRTPVHAPMLLRLPATTRRVRFTAVLPALPRLQVCRPHPRCRQPVQRQSRGRCAIASRLWYCARPHLPRGLTLAHAAVLLCSCAPVLLRSCACAHYCGDMRLVCPIRPKAQEVLRRNVWCRRRGMRSHRMRHRLATASITPRCSGDRALAP